VQSEPWNNTVRLNNHGEVAHPPRLLVRKNHSRYYIHNSYAFSRYDKFVFASIGALTRVLQQRKMAEELTP
jgi:hypothetical protein